MSKLSEYSKLDHLMEGDDDDDDDDDDQVNHRPHNNSHLPTLNPSTTTTSSPRRQQQQQQQQQQHVKPTSAASELPPRMVVSFQGRNIYEWEQSLDSVTIYVPAPSQCNNSIECRIAPNHLQLGLRPKQQPSNNTTTTAAATGVGVVTSWYLDEDTYGTVDTSESTWSLEDDDDNVDSKTALQTKKSIVIYLTKAHLGETWEAALRGNSKNLPTTTTTTRNNNDSNQQPVPLSSSSSPSPSAVAVIATKDDNALSMDPWTKQEVQRHLLLERFQQEHPGMDFRGASFNGSVPDPRTFLGGVHHHQHQH